MRGIGPLIVVVLVGSGCSTCNLGEGPIEPRRSANFRTIHNITKETVWISLKTAMAADFEILKSDDAKMELETSWREHDGWPSRHGMRVRAKGRVVEKENELFAEVAVSRGDEDPRSENWAFVGRDELWEMRILRALNTAVEGAAGR